MLDYWSTLSSPKLEEAIDEYTRLASNKMEDMMTKDFFIKNPKTTILESRYFKGLCYTTCIFKDKDGTLKSATTSCGDRCCKRLKIWKNNPKTGPVLIQKTFDVEGSPTCIGNSQPPCENAIKVTEICSHECNPRLIDEEKE